MRRSQQMNAGELIKQANQLKRSGKLDEAIALYRQVIEINPNFAWVYYNLGDIFVKQENLDEAVIYYRQGLEIAPSSPWFLYSLGNVLWATGDLEAATQYLEKAIDIKPGFYKFHQSLGEVLTQQGKFDEALVSYHKAINLNPQIANSYLGCCVGYIYKGELSRAHKYIERVLKLSPRIPKGNFYHEFLKTIDKLAIQAKSGVEKDVLNVVEAKENFRNGICSSNRARKILELVEDYLSQVRDQNDLKSIGFHRTHRCLSEMILPGGDYLDILKKLHFLLKPNTYVEIGIESGRSFRIAHPPTISIGIDPQPKLRKTPSSAKVFTLTSNEFFQQHNLLQELNNNTVDLAFIDGLHLFEQSLQDFINLEKYSSKKTIICFHDTLPLDRVTSNRDFSTMFWSGDVWKVVPILKQYRPDLEILTVPTKPTGLTIVTNLNADSVILSDHYDAIVNEYMNKEWVDDYDLRYAMLSVFSNNWNSIKARLKEVGLTQ